MSTGKGFQGWGGDPCPECKSAGRLDEIDAFFRNWQMTRESKTCLCKGTGKIAGDEKLLAYLWNNKHATPFEMAGMVIQVKAPIMVFREWHRHRTQSYNELSARYTPLPNENYLPTVERCIPKPSDQSNRQAQAFGTNTPTPAQVNLWLKELDDVYTRTQRVYENGLDLSIPKELARLSVPVARYSRMRASANLRNWLLFLTLRMAPNAQWEIRQFADAVGELVKQCFPRTWKLFAKNDNKSEKEIVYGNDQTTRTSRDKRAN